MSASSLTLRALNRATLARQMLLKRKKTPLPAAVAELVGLQAQMPKPPFVGLWSRLEGMTREQFADRLRDRTLVRATSMRGTLHVMTAADYLGLRASMQDGFDRALRAILRTRLDGIDVDRIVDTASTWFETPRTFDEMQAELHALHPTLDERAMGYAVRMTLPLVQVPEAGAAWAYPARATFIRADTWLKARPTPVAAPDALVLRYLAGYGPATIAEAQAWLGIPGLKPVFERLRPHLTSLRGPGRAELFDLPGAPRPDADAPAPVRFLPEWDNLLIGRTDARFVPTAHRKAVFLPGLRVLATVLVDGVVTGTWAVARAKATATLTVTAFAKMPKALRTEIEVEGERLLRFLEPAANGREVRFEP